MRQLRKAMRAIFCCLLLLPHCALADAYKCREMNRTIYSQLPCGAEAERVVENISITNPAFGQPVVAAATRSVTVGLNRQGGYTVSGAVNNVPASFQIDTGASVVTLSKRLSDRAGVTACERKLTTETANGSVEVCLAHVDELSFGAFRLRNVQVQIVPNMTSDALLGNSVLRNFRISQQDGVMTISD